MAMQVYPDGGAGDLTRFRRTENLASSSSRHHYGAWMLVQYIVDKHGGIAMFSGSIVVGGDAEPSTACSSGTYLLFNPDRGCDGKTGETDINPTYPPSPTPT
jgi:hypothetical protein